MDFDIFSELALKHNKTKFLVIVLYY